jgi:uncharacterized membrane protein
MQEIYAYIFKAAEIFSMLIGSIGISIIFFGTLKGLWTQIASKRYNFENARFVLSRYLVLGLDFLVAKDIIDTILLDTNKAGQEAWIDLVRLVVVVSIRIILNHFLEKEIRELKEMNTLGKRFQVQIEPRSKK